MDLYHAVLPPEYEKKIHFRTLNVLKKWIQLNPNLNQYIYTNEDSLNFFDYFDNKYQFDCKKLFIEQPDGRFKADLLRLCILYDRGGLYSDIDQEPIVPISEWLDDSIDFCIGLSQPSNYVSNGIIYCKPKSKIIKECLSKYIQVLKTKQKDPAAIHIMTDVIRPMLPQDFIATDEPIMIGNEKCIFLKEIPDWNLPKNSINFLLSFCYYFDKKRVINVRYNNYYYDKQDKQNFVSIK